MGVQLTGQGSTAAVGVDATFGALRVSGRPMEALNWQMVSTFSGNQTTTAVYNNTTGAGTIWSLRNNGPNLIAVRKFQVGFRTTTGFTAGQLMDYALVVGRNHVTPFVAGGTILYTTGALNVGRLDYRRHSPPPVSIITATTAGLTALTAGNVIFDAAAAGGPFLAYVNFFSPTTTTGNFLPMTTLFESLPGEPPLILKGMESLNLVNVVVMGAGGVGVATFNVEFAEIPAMALSVNA